MTVLLFIILILTEVVFGIMGLSRTILKKEWTVKRLIVNVIEMALYFFMILFPGIDFSFRFKALFLLLVIRVVFGILIYFICRKSEANKRKLNIVLSTVLSVILVVMSLLPAFVFADYKGRPLTGEFEVAESEAILIDSSRIETFEDDGSFREIPVHFYYPSVIDEMEPNSLPLVIFSHGAFGYYQSNASTYMELASHGYVVASLDHPYHAFFTRDSSGKTIIVNPDFFSTALAVGNNDDSMSEEELFEITSKWMELREADMNFVINMLKAGDIDDAWFYDDADQETIVAIVNSIDTTKIGLMGHSLGGATAVSVGRRDENEEIYTTPILSINNENHNNECLNAREMGYNYTNNVILDNAVTGYSTYFRGSEHMNFTDLPLFSPFLAKMLGTGSVDPKRCIDQVNEIVVDFMDCYLKGEGSFSIEECY